VREPKGRPRQGKVLETAARGALCDVDGNKRWVLWSQLGTSEQGPWGARALRLVRKAEPRHESEPDPCPYCEDRDCDGDCELARMGNQVTYVKREEPVQAQPKPTTKDDVQEQIDTLVQLGLELSSKLAARRREIADELGEKRAALRRIEGFVAELETEDKALAERIERIQALQKAVK
jgi:hypothetical protein